MGSSGIPSRMPGAYISNVSSSQHLATRVIGVYPHDPTAGYWRFDRYSDDDDRSSDCVSIDDEP